VFLARRSSMMLSFASPLNPAFHLILAITMEENQRYEESIGELREAIRLRHNYATAYYHLAMSQERIGSLQDARQSWQTFLQLADRGPDSSQQVRIAREHLARIAQ
jgi:Flp pilus assembly protein TadD